MSKTTWAVKIPGEFLGAWVLMLGVGVWHSDQPHVPTIGYFPALLILLGIGMITESLAKMERSR